MSKRVCPQPGCPKLTDGGRCPTHARQQDKARGTRQQRGYDAEHEAKRRHVAVKVARGAAVCARCGHPIKPGQPWDLDHTDDRKGYLGPSHAACNRATSGRR